MGQDDQIERACERLMYRYCQLMDHGKAVEAAELFSDDAECTILPGNTMRGRAAIAEGFAARQALTGRMSKHVCSTPLIDVIDEDNARGTVYLTLYRHDGEPGRSTSPLSGPVLVGEYRDQYTRTDEGWRIKKRALRIDFILEEP